MGTLHEFFRYFRENSNANRSLMRSIKAKPFPIIFHEISGI